MESASHSHIFTPRDRLAELSKGIRERVLTVKGTVEQIAQVFEHVCPRLVQGPVDAAAAAAAADDAGTWSGRTSRIVAFKDRPDIFTMTRFHTHGNVWSIFSVSSCSEMNMGVFLSLIILICI